MVKQRRRRRRSSKGGMEQKQPCVHPQQANPCSRCIPPQPWAFNNNRDNGNEANCRNSWQLIHPDQAGIGPFVDEQDCRNQFNCGPIAAHQAGGRKRRRKSRRKRRKSRKKKRKSRRKSRRSRRSRSRRKRR